MTPADATALVRTDMAALSDTRVRAHVTSLLVTPPQPLRIWVPRYSGEVYDGFLMLSHPSGAAIAYCPRDYDPAVPWGLVGTPKEPPALETWSHAGPPSWCRATRGLVAEAPAELIVRHGSPEPGERP